MQKHLKTQGLALAFDFGQARIGVAQGHSDMGMAHPLTTITGNSNDEKFKHIATLIQEWQPDYLVVGLPFHIDGTEHEITHLARQFGRRLHGRFHLPIYWVDERLSSLHAESLLHESFIKKHKKKSVLDQVAAQLILQNFFETGAIEYLLHRE